jgi:uncharacterized protein
MRIWIQLMIRHRRFVLFGFFFFSCWLALQITKLEIIIDPDNVFPQSHRFLRVGNEIEKIFGNKFTAVVGLSPRSGSIYQKDFLNKVKSVSDKISQTPGVVPGHLVDITSKKAKSITSDAGGMRVAPLIDNIDQDPNFTALKAGLYSNPVYEGLLFSKDEKHVQIVVEYKKIPGGFIAIEENLKQAIESENDNSFNYQLGGVPVFLSNLEKFSRRMGFLFPIALILIGFIHYEAFRTLQALFLPLVTALLAVIWSVGFLGFFGQPFDVFNASTPILILAIAAGHAVQILKRYYEEYSIAALKFQGLTAKELNDKAVEESMTKVGPVMIAACTVAALGFFSLIIFEIKTIRTFGLFCGMGVLSALVIELTLIPALRSLLPPPGRKELSREKSETFWDRLTKLFYNLVQNKRKQIYIVSSLIVFIFSLGIFWLKIDNSQKSYFYGQLKLMQDDEILNQAMAGTNLFYILIKGAAEDDLKRPDVLSAIDETQAYIETQPYVGKTVSIVNFIKRMNQAMNEDHLDKFKVPESQDLIAQYLLLYSNSGEPGDFDAWVDYSYQKANIAVFLKTDSTRYVKELVEKIDAFTKQRFPKDVIVEVGGGVTGGVALNDVMVQEKILNILQIMGAVFIVSTLVFRSLLAGVLILVPLVAAVVVNFGLMGLFGIPLQIATALVSAMAVGIGADYGIYMSFRMREELRQNADEAVAIQKAFMSAGKAALFVSSAVAGGFGVLILSWGFMIHMWMGFLIATAMLVSSVAALTVFPALVLSLRPGFIFENKKEAQL